MYLGVSSATTKFRTIASHATYAHTVISSVSQVSSTYWSDLVGLYSMPSSTSNPVAHAQVSRSPLLSYNVRKILEAECSKTTEHGH